MESDSFLQASIEVDDEASAILLSYFYVVFITRGFIQYDESVRVTTKAL